MRIKTVMATVSLAVFFLSATQTARAQKDGEAQFVFFDASNRPTLKFTNKAAKHQRCGTFASYTLVDNREEAIAVKATHLHVGSLGYRPMMPETGWLYITASRIIFAVEAGDSSHAFDVRRTDLRDKPAKTLGGVIFSSDFVGVKIYLKEKLPASNSDEQKFVFFIFGTKCGVLDPDPYSKFIERALNDFGGAAAEFKRVADSLKQSGKILEASRAYVVPPHNPSPTAALYGNSGGTAASSGDAMPPNPADGEVRALVEKLKDKDAGVRAETAQALASLGAGAKAAIPALVEAFRDSDNMVRFHALRGLGEIDADASVPALVNDLKDKDAQVRAAAAARLASVRWRARTAVPALVEALRDSDAKVRYYAVTALGHVWFMAKPGPDLEAAIPALVKLLKDADEFTRASAAFTLANMGAEVRAAVPALTEALTDENIEVKSYAASASGTSGGTVSKPSPP